MADAAIENQGRHDGEGFREIALDLWDNKPLLIGLAAILFVVVYLLAKNRSGIITAPGQTPGNPAPGASGAASGTYLIVNDVTPPNVSVTVNGATSGTGSTPLPPGPGPVPGPIGNPCKPGYHFVPRMGIFQPLTLIKGAYPVAGGVCVPDSPVPTPTPTPTPPTPTPIPPPSPAARYVHPQKWPSLQSTLSGIASAYGISLGKLESMNQWIIQQRGTWNLIYPSDNIRVA